MPGFWPLIIQLWVEWSGVYICGCTNFFLSAAKCPDWAWGLPKLLYSGYRSSFLEVKQLGHGIYHSAPSGAEVKNGSNYTFIQPICLCGMERYNFIQSNTWLLSGIIIPFFFFFSLSHVCKFNIDRMKYKIIVYVQSSFWTSGWCISLHYQTGW